jgi:hypothetical protein
VDDGIAACHCGAQRGWLQHIAVGPLNALQAIGRGQQRLQIL